MKENTSREEVLKAVRKALIHKSEVDYSSADSDTEIYTSPEEDSLELLFAKIFSSLKGNFIFCETKDDFPKILATLIEENKWNNIFCAEPEIAQCSKRAKFIFFQMKRIFFPAMWVLRFASFW